jgi:hypothetical protein
MTNLDSIESMLSTLDSDLNQGLTDWVTDYPLEGGFAIGGESVPCIDKRVVIRLEELLVNSGRLDI